MIIRSLYLILVVFLSACANIKPPTGGDKDLEPPLMIRSVPEHNSINFNGDEITLFFNEQVETKNLLSELIITPDDNIKIKEIPRKKSITIRLKDTLRQNTTYNLNFGKSVVDITERNPSSNAIIAFSTGDDIDTAFIKGKAIDMFTQQALEKDVVAVLQPNNDTIDIQKHKPAYLSRVDETGNFTINNLPNKEFRLYGIQDKNGNLIYNVGKEKVALYPYFITPSYQDTIYELFLSPQDTRSFKLLSSKHHYNYSSFSFNKGILNYEIDTDTLYTFTSNNTRNINIFHPFKFNDSIPIKLLTSDSSNYNFDSLIYIKKDLESDTIKPDFFLSINPPPGDISKLPDTIELNFNLRVKSFITDTALIITDKLDSTYSTPIEHAKLSDHAFFIINPKPKKRSIDIKLLNGHVTSIYKDTIRNITMKYNIPPEENFGQIDGTIKSTYENLILQLINSKGVTKKEQFLSPGHFSFTYINPGTYKLRVIHDANNNRIWDTGDHYQNIQPEKVVIYDEDILIKANWIIEDKILTIK